MKNFKEVYTRANNEICGDRSILDGKSKKRAPVKFAGMVAAAAAVCLVTVFAYPYILTGDVTEELPSPAAYMEEVQRARNMPAQPVYMEDKEKLLWENEATITKITEREIVVKDKKGKEHTYEISSATNIQSSEGEQLTTRDVKKGDTVLVLCKEGSSLASTIVVK